MDSRALILSGSIGQGHTVVAQVCAGALEQTPLVSPPARVPVVDCMGLLGPVESRVAKRVFRTMIGLPALYDGFHFSHLRAEGRLSRRGNRSAVRRIAGALEREGALGRVDLVLSVFAMGASVAAEVKQRTPATRSVVFCTDATAHSRWTDETVDLYLATSDLAAASVRRYEPDAEVRIVPPAVRAPFYEAEERHLARARFGVPIGESCVLLVTGGWGLGPVAQVAKALAEEGHYVLAVSGSNRRLEHELQELARGCDRLRSLGHCDQMPSAISAADVVVAGPGQTCHEVHVVGRPLVVLDVVPGHGRENLLHEVAANGAIPASPVPDSVVAAVRTARKQPQPAPRWPVRSEREWRRRFLRALEPLGVT